MKIASLLLPLLLMLAAATAGADQPALTSAAQAAASGDYRTAVRNYEMILEQEGFSAPVLFNLGNAWLRLGNPARAILEYERALVLSPHSAPIAANLAAAQQRAGLAPQAVGPWLAAVRYFSFDAYVWAGLAALWVLCAALVLVAVNGAARRIATPLIVVAAVTLCVSADAAVLEWPDLQRAVVLAPSVMHLAPAESAATSGSLREGEVVWLQDQYAGFNFVRSGDGRTGWVGAAAVVAVRVPRP
jgi:tetratricopeptide (TPR) repeat protein